MKKILAFPLLIITFFVSAQIQSPEDFLGYELGTKFTRHHRVVDYYQHLAANSDLVQLVEYGKTYEDRPLLLAYISTASNLSNLEEIRTDNIKRAKLEEGEPNTSVGIVWLSYNVHGNESVSTEASMATIYNLITEKQDWLENTVVIIDPCINPDGRERYVNFYWQNGNQPYNPDPNSAEHMEPWPRGRANHYMYDLNRDWAWQTQVESKQRLKVYNDWLPHVHVDFHEQGVNSPYYFAPAAEPYHELITDWQRQFQTDIGKNNAKYFDRNDWFYFTKERFDLLYPSYGDTYPTYNGSIGMTYEQGGSGRAGLGVHTQEMDTLTLVDRIAHHYTTGLGTIEEAVKQRQKMLDEFEQYFETAITNPAGEYKTYVIKNDHEGKISALKSWLDTHDIQYGTASGRGLKGFSYSANADKTFTISSRDLVISTKQPKSVLISVLFEPDTYWSDSLTYDITAWSVPYAYGLEAYALTSALSVNVGHSSPDFQDNKAPSKAYAFVFAWEDMSDAQFLSALIQEGYKTRFTSKPINYGGNTFDRGAIIVARRDNKSKPNFEQSLTDLANLHSQQIIALGTGFADRGPDIGSNEIVYMKAPKVAMISGEGTSSLAAGATWYYFEQEVKYPVSVLKLSYFNRIDLDKYDVLVLPDGWYGNLEDSHLSSINDWVRSGGRLVLIQGAIGPFADSDYSKIKEYGTDKEEKDAKSTEEKVTEKRKLMKYADAEREFIKEYVAGAVFRVTMDKTNPLAYGYGDTYFSLKTSEDRYGLLEDEWNVGYVRSGQDHVAGFAGEYVKATVGNSLVFGVEGRGRGEIVYLVDNPLFRSFWHNGKLLLANALFMNGQ